MSDPYRILGVPVSADDQTIRAAYLALLRAYPPDHHPQRFEQVRAAYEAIATERDRLNHALFDASAPTPADILAALGTDTHPCPVNAQRFNRLLTGSNG